MCLMSARLKATHANCSSKHGDHYACLCMAVVLATVFFEVIFMFKLMAWLGIYVGAPSAVTYVTLSYQDHFVVIFVLVTGTVLLAILPLLGNQTRH
jgi:hypothetical protein